VTFQELHVTRPLEQNHFVRRKQEAAWRHCGTRDVIRHTYRSARYARAVAGIGRSKWRHVLGSTSKSNNKPDRCTFAGTEQLVVDYTRSIRRPLGHSGSGHSAWVSDHRQAHVGLEPGIAMSDRPVVVGSSRPLHAAVNVLA